jgi:hypothetical protein
MDISPSRTGLLAQTFWRSPGSRAHCFLTCWGSSTTPSPAAARELTRFAGVAFPLTEKGRHSDCSFRSSMARPPVPLSTLQLSPSRATVQDSRPEWSRFSFSVGLSHPLQCAGLARRSLSPGLCLRPSYGYLAFSNAHQKKRKQTSVESLGRSCCERATGLQRSRHRLDQELPLLRRPWHDLHR